jgi:DNA-binding response OmpR family regulator
MSSTMDQLPPELDAFIHSLISPLTALQGSASLLRRRYGASDDPRMNDLLLAMERSTTRLRHVCELLINHTHLHDEQIQIHLPTTLIQTPQYQTTASAARQLVEREHLHNLPRTQTGPVVIIAQQQLAEALQRELGAQQIQVVTAFSAAAGVDLARQERPLAIVLELGLDGQSRMAAPLLREDPDTKAAPLALLVDNFVDAADVATAQQVFAQTTPVAQIAQGVLQMISEAQTAEQDVPHLLIVDDDPDIAHLIAQQFRDEGYLASIVHHGTAALQIVRERQFDLILLDLLLPDLDGFTVLGGLRARAETQLTPILLLSAINSPAEKVRGLQLGADDYVTKPFSAAELSARVQAAMRRSEREGGANPSTRLPGNVAIERALLQRIEQQAPFAVCYCDLDNFKAYNDAYGFLKGDAVIQRTAQILMDAVRIAGNADDFVGHIGGDDFIVISTPDRVEAVCQATISRFDAAVPLFYHQEVRERGYITGVDRRGQPASFPLLALSIVVVSNAKRPFSHPGEIAQRSVIPKKQAKLVEQSTYIIVE